MPELDMEGLNQGDDITGTAHMVSSKVTKFHPGDRVAGFHTVAKPGGSIRNMPSRHFHMTFHIPSTTPFEEVAREQGPKTGEYLRGLCIRST
jgi:NADPH2:quinone reductase